MYRLFRLASYIDFHRGWFYLQGSVLGGKPGESDCERNLVNDDERCIGVASTYTMFSHLATMC